MEKITKIEMRKINNEIKIKLLKLNISAFLIWSLIVYFLYITVNVKNRSIITYLIGWLFSSYLLFYHYISEKNAILKIDDYKKEIKKIQNEINSDKTIVKTFPLIIFALGVILKPRFDNNTNIINYFIFCIVFGIIIPFIIDTLIIDYENIRRLLLFENLEFINISYAFGILLITLLNIIIGKNL